jgi:cytochrome c biogenesis protein CcmG/thiol:disulfide interchange protein DsbE
MKPALRFAIPLALFAALLAFCAVGLHLDPREVPSPLIGKPAPDFSLSRLDAPERTIRRADLLGKVWMLNVWASWCEACREEHPALVEFAKAKAVPIYGLDYKDQRPPAQAWLAERGDPYDASLFDESGRVGIDFGVYGVPETFVVDQRGVIRFKQIGPLTPEVLRDKVMPLLRRLNG